ncbi:zinc-ribbon domain-containing protein [Paracoccus caeni]|uniref:Zinc-ribbon domain-containing protein n=1 Tax=Paracoccus caeni TaxID=657651 RepID=A0A934VTH9_9RHOB|nr:zinc-ribbon domain-containing protein [Paracoccus caeni]MBK4214741.1 zinc-ribbon domain-containing protein [Paracoccus caeni]
MAEIRVICPNCRTAYEIPASALPPQGREVECSNCGRIWRAQLPSTSQPSPLELGVYSYNLTGFKELADEYARTTKPASPEATSKGPAPLNRRLPENVLNILLEEVEHERRLRKAEGTRTDSLPVRADFNYEGDPDWPAMTMTNPVSRPTPAASQAVPEPAAEPDPAPTPATTEQQVSEVQPQTVSPNARGGYWAGFGLAAGLAALCVGLYLAAPSLSDNGSFGEVLMTMRDGVDQARLWLHDTVSGNGG